MDFLQLLFRDADVSGTFRHPEQWLSALPPPGLLDTAVFDYSLEARRDGRSKRLFCCNRHRKRGRVGNGGSKRHPLCMESQP